jgi:hypothetical protein
VQYGIPLNLKNFGSGRIGWDDAVARRIKEQVSVASALLRAACAILV